MVIKDGYQGRFSGTVYFADDDNAYSATLFTDCLPNVRTASIWPVGTPQRLP